MLEIHRFYEQNVIFIRNRQKTDHTAEQCPTKLKTGPKLPKKTRGRSGEKRGEAGRSGEEAGRSGEKRGEAGKPLNMADDRALGHYSKIRLFFRGTHSNIEKMTKTIQIPTKPTNPI